MFVIKLITLISHEVTYTFNYNDLFKCKNIFYNRIYLGMHKTLKYYLCMN